MNKVLADTLLKGSSELKYNLSDEQLYLFDKYYNLLLERNKFINLTAITEPSEVAVKHFLDSMTCLPIIDSIHQPRVIDVGTGAGFPGIVLKIIKPDLKIVLLDSLRKRVEFLNEIINCLNLKDIIAVHGRAEEFGRNNNYREKYDAAVSRAVANMNVLSEYCMPFIKKNGLFIAMKGPKAGEEIKCSQKAVNVLGGEISDVNELNLPLINEKRTLIIVKKIFPTPEKYPRRPGIPAKKPLK
ncbi:MAG: 16S rRNA (guanine(527)-N(7))-methyltransferase RsmG [Desulfotomaculum sp.]|nr:16S rRNA (guanine(527)-N(7))-methyltransferase RsmG [Desulfotomaculum sp.]